MAALCYSNNLRRDKALGKDICKARWGHRIREMGMVGVMADKDK